MRATVEEWGFGILCLLLLVAFAWLAWPLLAPIVLAAFAVVVLHPLHVWLCRHLGGRRGLAALVAALLALAGLALLGWATFHLVDVEARSLVAQAHAQLGGERITQYLGERLPPSLRRAFDPATVQAHVSTGLEHLGERLGVLVREGAKHGARIGMGAVILLVSAYSFFLEGPRILAAIVRAAPLRPAYTRELLAEFASVMHAMFFTSAAVAAIQAAVSWIGFSLAHVPHAIVWAVLLGLFSPVPLVGAAVVWVPVCIALFVTGHISAGAFLVAWSLVVMGGVDHVVRPLLMRGRIHVPPLLVFVSLFGGLATLGAEGAILGPLLGVAVAAALRIWDRDFVPGLRSGGAPD